MHSNDGSILMYIMNMCYRVFSVVLAVRIGGFIFPILFAAMILIGLGDSAWIPFLIFYNARWMAGNLIWSGAWKLFKLEV